MKLCYCTCSLCFLFPKFVLLFLPLWSLAHRSAGLYPSKEGQNTHFVKSKEKKKKVKKGREGKDSEKGKTNTKRRR